MEDIAAGNNGFDIAGLERERPIAGDESFVEALEVAQDEGAAGVTFRVARRQSQRLIETRERFRRPLADAQQMTTFF